MTDEQIIKFLKRIYVWIPQDNPMRREIKEFVQKMGGRIV